MLIIITVTVEVERIEGKFASREELTERLVAEIESADPASLEGDNGGQYEVTSFEVVAS